MSGENSVQQSSTHNPQPSLKRTEGGNGYPSDALREGECGVEVLDSPPIILIEVKVNRTAVAERMGGPPILVVRAVARDGLINTGIE